MLIDDPGACDGSLCTGEALRDEEALGPTAGDVGVGVIDRSELSVDEGFRSLVTEELDEVLLSVLNRGGYGIPGCC